MQRSTGHTRIKKKLDKIGTKKPEVEQSILTLSSLYLDEKAELKTKLKAEEESTKDTPTCLHTMYTENQTKCKINIGKKYSQTKWLSG